MFPNQFGQRMSDRSPAEASSDGGYVTAPNGGGSTTSTDGSEAAAADKQQQTGERWNSASTASDAMQRHGSYAPQGNAQIATTTTSAGGDDMMSPYDEYAGGSSSMMLPPMNVDAVIVREQDIRDQTRRQVIAELSQFASAIKTEGAPITINNMHQSSTNTMMNSNGNTDDPPERPKSSIEVLADSFNRFFESPFNKVCFVGISSVSLYLVYNYYTHKWREEELQRKIDANFLLRWVLDQIDRRIDYVWSFRYLSSVGR
ncbi:hypothetical protein FOZ60_015848 [Perkinsus olseni]|uniref:Uncharacterized protein n=1 Tax=Perkinsus olseni TaxID=32597 RepID=A0A7J6P6E0_PEROL|nr:hypothetical protein FOZ60_015848 [Perkinsus olseni]